MTQMKSPESLYPEANSTWGYKPVTDSEPSKPVLSVMSKTIDTQASPVPLYPQIPSRAHYMTRETIISGYKGGEIHVEGCMQHFGGTRVQARNREVIL